MCVLGVSAIVLFYAYAGEVKRTMYYPAPYGEYKRTVTKTFGVGANNSDGNIDFNDAPGPIDNPGDVRIKGKVGIGMASPDEKFEVEWVSDGTDVEIGRGTVDADMTFIALRNVNGTKC